MRQQIEAVRGLLAILALGFSAAAVLLAVIGLTHRAIVCALLFIGFTLAAGQ